MDVKESCCQQCTGPAPCRQLPSFARHISVVIQTSAETQQSSVTTGGVPSNYLASGHTEDNRNSTLWQQNNFQVSIIFSRKRNNFPTDNCYNRVILKQLVCHRSQRQFSGRSVGVRDRNHVVGPPATDDDFSNLKSPGGLHHNVLQAWNLW